MVDLGCGIVPLKRILRFFTRLIDPESKFGNHKGSGNEPKDALERTRKEWLMWICFHFPMRVSQHRRPAKMVSVLFSFRFKEQ